MSTLLTTRPRTPVGDSRPAPTRLRRILGFGLDAGRVKSWTGFFVLLLVGNALIAVLAIALVTHHGKTLERSAAPPTSPASTPAAALSGPAAWMNRELPKTAGVLATGRVRADLLRAGFGKVVDAAGVQAGQVQYLVSDATLRDDAAGNAVIAQLLAYSAPIAAFGTGDDQVVVRQTTAVPEVTRTAHHASGVRQRAGQERQLLENRRLHVDADGARILRAGGLDLRAAAVLALLADAAPLQVQIVVDPAERAAGLPARRILVRSSAPDTVHGVLAALPASYRLSGDERLATGWERLVWPIDPDPAVPN